MDTAFKDFFDRKTVVPKDKSQCWIWVGSTDRGYGRMRPKRGVNIAAHRFSYEIHKGKIRAGLVIDHLCRVRNCVNPDHLETVSIGENILRGHKFPTYKIGRRVIRKKYVYSRTEEERKERKRKINTLMQQRWRESHREEHRRRSRAFYKKNKHKVLARKKELYNKRTLPA